MNAAASHDWFAAAVAGCAIGLASVSLPVIGWPLGLALLAGAARSRHRAPAVGGALAGLGLVWVLVWTAAALRCDPASCRGPDLTPWVVGSAGTLGVGVLVSVAGLRRGRG